MPAMRKIFSIASALFIGLALTLSACGKDKKPATNEPAATEPAKSDPAAKTEAPKAEPTAAEPKAEEKPKGGW